MLEADPAFPRHHGIAGRSVRLVDTEDRDRIAQIKAENLSFKRDVKLALCAEYGPPLSERAIQEVRAQRASADLTSAEDIFKEDIDLLLAHTKGLYISSQVDKFLGPDVPIDGSSLIGREPVANASAFERGYLKMYQCSPKSVLNYLSLKDFRHPKLIERVRAHLYEASLLDPTILNPFLLSGQATAVILQFAAERRSACLHSIARIAELLPSEIAQRIFRFMMRRDLPGPR